MKVKFSGVQLSYKYPHVHTYVASCLGHRKDVLLSPIARLLATYGDVVIIFRW